MLFISHRSWRHALWLALAFVGVVAVTGAAVWLWRLASAPSHELPGLILALFGLFVGVAQVIVAMLQLSRFPSHGTALPDETGHGQADHAAGSPRPGMVSLAPPDGLLEPRVRGRSDLIDELVRLVLRRNKREPGVHVLHGMGGSGKTTVTLAVARHAGTRGVTVWWISAATVSSMETGLRQLLRRLGATDSELRREWTDGGPDLLWHRLDHASRRWLLIIDNADDTRALCPEGETIAGHRGWVRPVRSRRGAILITSRDGEPQAWGASGGGEPWCALHHVGMLSNADSARVLLDRAGDGAGSVTDAALLGARLGGLALALRLAGAYLADTNRLPLPGAVTTFTAYRQSLEAGRLETVFDAGPQSLREETARGIIDRTWELSLDLLRRRGLGQARPLLRLLAMFADAPIPYQLVLDPAILSRTPMLEGVDMAGLRRLLHGLAELSLIDLTVAAETSDPVPSLRLHPLIRDTCRHHADVAGEFASYLAATVGLLAQATQAAQTGPPDDPASWPHWAVLSPHVLAAFDTVAASSESESESDAEAEVRRRACEPAAAVARYLAESGQYAAARDVYKGLAATTAELDGETSLNTVTVRANLALWTGHAGDAVAARDQFAALTSTVDGAFGPDHPVTLAVSANLADWTGHCGDAVSACAHFSELLARYRRILGPDHPDTLAVHANLAWWTGVAGHAGAARDQFAALLPQRLRVLGAEHPATLTASANLALWTGAAGEVTAALSQYTALLPVFTRVFGAEHPSSLSVRANLARWTGNAGSAAHALDMYRELHPTVDRVLGETHPATLVLRANIALWTGVAGDPADARRQFAELLPVRVRVSGAEHPSTLVVSANLAYWTIESGQALAEGEKVALLAVVQRVLGPEHPTTVVLQAQFTREPGTPAPQAIVHPSNALIPIVERIIGAEHPRTMVLGDAVGPRSPV